MAGVLMVGIMANTRIMAMALMTVRNRNTILQLILSTKKPARMGDVYKRQDKKLREGGHPVDSNRRNMQRGFHAGVNSFLPAPQTLTTM